MTNYTGGEIIAKYLIKEGFNYVVGIPGHGNLALTDYFSKKIKKKEGTVQHLQQKAEKPILLISQKLGKHLAVMLKKSLKWKRLSPL